MALQMTPTAITKVKEVLAQQEPKPTGLRLGVMGGGCSGFSYQMVFETGRRRLQVRQPQRQNHLRLRQLLQRVKHADRTYRIPSASTCDLWVMRPTHR
jgi:Fe-S cluster assembly iron-binding protein IscA